jgi:hypothetical protein
MDKHGIAQQLKENKVYVIVSYFAFNHLFYVVLWYCTVHPSDSESIGSAATTTTSTTTTITATTTTTTTATDIAFPS